MKILTVLLALSIGLSGAHASSHDPLSIALDNFQYALTVEWDQEDMDFYEQQVQIFSDTVSKLQEDGISNEELMTFIMSKAKDERLSQDLRHLKQVLSAHKMSKKQAQEFLKEYAQKSYAQGASWDPLDYAGPGMLVLSLGIIITAVVMVESP